MKILKNNIKLFIGIIIGVVLGCVSVYAFTISSSDVSYDNNISGVEVDNVKDALDTLYEKMTNSFSSDSIIISSGSVTVETGKRYIVSVAYYLDNCARGGYPVTSSIGLTGATIEQQTELLYFNNRVTDGGNYSYGSASQTFIVTATDDTITPTITRVKDGNSVERSHIMVVELN